MKRLTESEDVLKRARGRRGMDMLARLQESGVIIQFDSSEFEEDIENRLLKLAKDKNAAIITNDYNLNKLAHAGGVKILNLNDLSNAVKPVLLPGEELNLQIVREGKEPGQGVAYFEDGTICMVRQFRYAMQQELWELPAGKLEKGEDPFEAAKRELEEDGVPTAQGVERWSPSIIHNILTNEKYIGDALLQKTYVTDCINKKVKKNRGERTMYYVENSHPAIVARDLFNQVQQEMTRRSSKRKVLQKSGKTELGKYSGKYALTELLVCGECGSPYKRVTWARNGKKRIVWRCVSRLEFGTKYCQHSPTLDEGRLHSAILAAMNEYAAIRQEVCPDVLAMAEEAKQALSQAGARLLQLKKRMDAVSREQSDVLDRLLVNMADTELNARMKALTDEKESLKAQIADAQQAEVDLGEQAARRRQMWDRSWNAPRATRNLTMSSSGRSSKRSRWRMRKPSTSTSETRMWCWNRK